jgi:2,5-diamino-6-(ribosylamino)-4(3H)-pyrimidinone 5'-phosphate reductase
MSADGKLALPDRSQIEISSEEDMLRVHRLRASSDAILVGVGTVVADDPKLHVSPARVPSPPTPTKVVLDSSGRTPADARVIASPGRTLIATLEGQEEGLRRTLGDRADVMAFGPGPLVDLHALLAHLADQGVGRLMVEGGGETIWSFLESGLVDELSVYVGPLAIGGCDSPTPADGPGATCLEDAVRLEVISCERLGEGVWLRYRVLDRP